MFCDKSWAPVGFRRDGGGGTTWHHLAPPQHHLEKLHWAAPPSAPPCFATSRGRQWDLGVTPVVAPPGTTWHHLGTTSKNWTGPKENPYLNSLKDVGTTWPHRRHHHVLRQVMGASAIRLIVQLSNYSTN